MSWVAVGVGVAGVAVTLYSGNQSKKAYDKQAQRTEQAGQIAQAADNFEANVLEVEATQDIAIAQRNMMDAQRTTALAMSRATALAAASGGGATSPTVLNVMGNLAREGSYNAARALYAGEESARILRIQAFQKRQQGTYDALTGQWGADAAYAKGRGSALAGYGTALSQGGSLYDKYARANPPSAGAVTPASDFQFNGYDAGGGPAYG